MLSGSALSIFKSQTVKSIIGLAVKYGYSELQKKNAFYKVLHELGLSRPKDEFRSLFLHTTFLSNHFIEDLKRISASCDPMAH